MNQARPEWQIICLSCPEAIDILQIKGSHLVSDRLGELYFTDINDRIGKTVLREAAKLNQDKGEGDQEMS
jgi:hypothetical protein